MKSSSARYGRHALGISLRCLTMLSSCALLAQAPEDWNRREALGADLPSGTSWFGAGLWGADQHGAPATLVDSLGVGNGYIGEGVSAQAGVNLRSWSFAIQGYADADAQGRSHFTVMRSHALYHSDGGWTAGFDQEPMVWGYGLTGGYLLGEADRPFPKMRVESPYAHLSIGNWSLGKWGFQWFTGRLENGRGIPENSQVPLSMGKTLAQGDPQSPFFTGYRLQAQSLSGKVEYYLNWTVLWGGTKNGVPMTQGYNLGEYLTAISGAKDPLAESGIDFNDPNHPQAGYVNAARSSTNFDTGIRFRADWLARLASSEKAYIYLSRGSKGMLIQWKTLVHKPAYYVGKDVEYYVKNTLQLQASRLWNNTSSYVVPNLIVPNDTIGFLFQWPSVRLGIEHVDTTNSAGKSYRSFVNSTYPSGFYYHGDPLGGAMGGEASFTDARLELDLGPRLSSTTWVFAGTRPFRDDIALWSELHPGLTPADDGFQGVQQNVAWKVTPGATLSLGASWQRHQALGWVPGETRNGFRWFGELAFRWPRTPGGAR